MAVLVDDSTEKIMLVYDEEFDLSGFARLMPAPQEVARQRAIGSVFAVAPLVLTQRLAQMGLIPDQRAVEQVIATFLRQSDTDQPHKTD